jgi:hypothetical protein
MFKKTGQGDGFNILIFHYVLPTAARETLFPPLFFYAIVPPCFCFLKELSRHDHVPGQYSATR